MGGGIFKFCDSSKDGANKRVDSALNSVMTAQPVFVLGTICVQVFALRTALGYPQGFQATQ